MNQIKPVAENILYECIIPIMFVTQKDITQFQTDPIEYIRSQYDFQEATYQAKN
jgi:hypothetical protein